MFRPIVISLSPNTNFDDVFLSFKLLLTPWRWQKGNAVHQLEEKIKKYFNAQFCTTFASGRQCLLAILKSLNLKKGDEILCQAFTCVVVPNSILGSGSRPIFVDIDQTLNLDPDDLLKKITPQSRAVIVQHTFGQPAAMTQIVSICQKHHLILIEDCAHALGSQYQNQKVGTLGDVAFFSFGRDKIISSIFGGVAITNDRRLGQKLKELKNQASLPGFFWIGQQLLHPILFHFLILPFYFFQSLGKIFLVLCQKLKLLSLAVTSSEKKGCFSSQIFQFPDALACLALNQFNKLDSFNQHRQKIAGIYFQKLSQTPCQLPITTNQTKSVFLRFNIQVDQPLQLIKLAKKQQILLGDWYRPVIAPSGVNFDSIYYQKGSCPQAEIASQKSINLPTYPSLSLKDAQKVVNLIKKFYGN